MLGEPQVEEVFRRLADAMPGRTTDAKGPKGQRDAFRSCISWMLSAQSLDRNTAAATKALFAQATAPQRSPESAMAGGDFWVIQFGKQVCRSRFPRCEERRVSDLCEYYARAGFAD